MSKKKEGNSQACVEFSFQLNWKLRCENDKKKGVQDGSVSLMRENLAGWQKQINTNSDP